MVIRRILLGALALAATLAAGCTSEETPQGSLPDGSTLLKEASAATAGINSTHFTLRVDGTVAGLAVQSLDGDLTKDGQAKGSGTLKQAGQLVEVEFVLTGGTLYLKGPTGGYQEIPAALSSSLYDPAAVLDPERGVAKLLSSTQNAATEATEDVGGTRTYKITGTVGKDVLGSLLPGVPSGADMTYWLRTDGKHLPVKATAAFADGATAEVMLSDVDKPVTVTPPA